MDILDKKMNLRVNQSRLCELRNLCRTKLEYTLVGGIPRINTASRDNPTARECWNILTRPALPPCLLTGLRARSLRGRGRGRWVTSWWIYFLTTIHGTHLLRVPVSHNGNIPVHIALLSVAPLMELKWRHEGSVANDTTCPR